MTRITVSKETLDAAVAGSAAAIDTIVRTLQQPFYSLARKMLFDPTDAEDATQEALLRVVTHLSQFRGQARFSSWAWRIAVNQCLDHRQKRYRLAVLTDETFAADLADGLEPGAPERPDDAYLLEQVKLGCGMAMLCILDGEHRAAYVLGEILELSSDEAAEVLELDPVTFRKRLSRARERVREVLERHCGVYTESNACRCHRRLDRARQLGRVTAAEGSPPSAPLDVPALRARLQSIPPLQRAVEFYRADPEPQARRDFTGEVRKLLRASPLS